MLPPGPPLLGSSVETNARDAPAGSDSRSALWEEAFLPQPRKAAPSALAPPQKQGRPRRGDQAPSLEGRFLIWTDGTKGGRQESNHSIHQLNSIPRKSKTVVQNMRYLELRLPATITHALRRKARPFPKLNSIRRSKMPVIQLLQEASLLDKRAADRHKQGVPGPEGE